MEAMSAGLLITLIGCYFIPSLVAMIFAARSAWVA